MAGKKTFEQAIRRLEEIVEKMKDEDTSINESLKLYKEGVELSLFCSESLSRTEQEVKMLRESAGGVFKTVNFIDLED